MLHPAVEIDVDAIAYHKKNPQWEESIRKVMALVQMDSPAEQLFFVWWWFDLSHRPLLLPQTWIADYRVDFLVEGKLFVIEIDGRWHDESLTQVLYDRRRDRALLKAGYRIIRFTASEVFADVTACVDEALAIIRAHETADV